MRTFPHLSRALMDYWFKRLIETRMNKQLVMSEIAETYGLYNSKLFDRRDKLVNLLGIMRGNMELARQRVRDAESATAALDSLIDNIAFAAQMAYSVCKLVKPALRVGFAVKEAIDNKELIRESTKYWPGVNDYRAVLSDVEKAKVREAARNLGKEFAKETGAETIKTFVNKYTHILDPSFWARKAMGETPEEEFRKRRQEIEQAEQEAEQFLSTRMKELDTKILQSRNEYQELIVYIRAC